MPSIFISKQIYMIEELKLAIARNKLKEVQKILIGNKYEQLLIEHFNVIQNEIESQLHQLSEGEFT